jgi:acyl carrier protein
MDTHSPDTAELLTPTEQTIAEIWRDLFGVANVTPSNNFFDLGGNSLTAVKFLSRVEKKFGPDALLPETLYQNAQLRSLAAAIDQSIAAAS